MAILRVLTASVRDRLYMRELTIRSAFVEVRKLLENLSDRSNKSREPQSLKSTLKQMVSKATFG